MSEFTKQFRKRVPFVKASGAGNDFLIVREEDAPGDLPAFAKMICDRTNGIGADGVELVSALKGGAADVKARLINSDGSEAEISGNGTRCVAAYWSASHKSSNVRVLTGAGVRTCLLLKREGARFEFEMNMGAASVHDEENMFLEEGAVTGWPVDMGNPHFVVFVRSFDFSWQRVGGEIQAHSSRFPNGTNVEFVFKRGEHEVETRFFERGAGETKSSGTGSCAAAAASIVSGRCVSPVEVVAAGGTQTVRVENGDFCLQGPAHLIGEGEFFI